MSEAKRSKNLTPFLQAAPFFQEGPHLKNSFESDDLLRHFLRWRMPAEILGEIETGLSAFGERVTSDILRLGDAAETHPPRLVPYDPWGRRIDEIEVHEAWEKLHRVSAEEGLIAIGYERAHGEWSRLHQFAKLYLFHPSSAFYTCPLAMTDGAARVLELYGSPEMKKGAFQNLISRNPQRFWTSGQWMTERTGGSDVSGTSTWARWKDGSYRLYGDKWFTSATTSQMTLALAKIDEESAAAEVVQGSGDSRGDLGGDLGGDLSKTALSLFFIELRDEAGHLRKIRINRLKDKLGTKALPTAELTLEGTPAQMIGGPGEGVKRIAALLNITRLYNSVCALGTMTRTWQLAKDYAVRRVAFGKPLSKHPLHLQTLGDLRSEYEAMFHLVFHLVQLLGKEEVKKASPEETVILRLLTPIAKLMTGKQAMAHTSEVIESFGGAGYIEDTGLPRHLRDAQVYSIWEGTTNVLSLDVLRAIAKENALDPFLKDIEARLSKIKSESLQAQVGATRAAIKTLREHFQMLVGSGADAMQAAARQFAFGLGRTFTGALMLEFADWCESKKLRPASTDVVWRFYQRPLAPVLSEESLDVARLERLVFG